MSKNEEAFATFKSDVDDLLDDVNDKEQYGKIDWSQLLAFLSKILTQLAPMIIPLFMEKEEKKDES